MQPDQPPEERRIHYDCAIIDADLAPNVDTNQALGRTAGRLIL